MRIIWPFLLVVEVRDAHRQIEWNHRIDEEGDDAA
jgi:hypothetical protein